MKVRGCFVSNSSSSSFVIMNTTAEWLTLADFVQENAQVIEQYVEEHAWWKEEKYNQGALLRCAEEHPMEFLPGENTVYFSDEQGRATDVLRSALLAGDRSARFVWWFKESLQ